MAPANSEKLIMSYLGAVGGFKGKCRPVDNSIQRVEWGLFQFQWVAVHLSSKTNTNEALLSKFRNKTRKK